MPEVRISVGGREFDVACQNGEEHYLRAAAQLLDAEATSLINQIGRVPENQMLLMAALMLADKAAGLEDQLVAVEERARQAETAYDRVRTSGPTRVEVPVIPAAVTTTLADLAAQAEALAAVIEAQASAA
jgi:cell division protein ZapA